MKKIFQSYEIESFSIDRLKSELKSLSLEHNKLQTEFKSLKYAALLKIQSLIKDYDQLKRKSLELDIPNYQKDLIEYQKRKIKSLEKDNADLISDIVDLEAQVPLPNSMPLGTKSSEQDVTDLLIVEQQKNDDLSKKNKELESYISKMKKEYQYINILNAKLRALEKKNKYLNNKIQELEKKIISQNNEHNITKKQNNNKMYVLNILFCLFIIFALLSICVFVYYLYKYKLQKKQSVEIIIN
ncbi:hypothetical protein AB837_00453 [bacterium AB1]|nr:hypothetical protein AB837_00453 [bacterium AB1]